MMQVVPLHLDYPLSSGHKASRIVCQDDWKKYAGSDWEDSMMELELSDRFHAKQGRSIVRWTLGNEGQSLTVYLKRHYKLPVGMKWARKLFPNSNWTPGLQEYANLEWAAGQGIPVPRAMAAGEFADDRGNLQGFIAIAELTDMLALHEALPLAQSKLMPKEFREWKQGLFDELARLTHLFHDANVYHKDWYLCHFYTREEDCVRSVVDWKNRVSVIDLHRMKRHPLFGFWQRMKDLAQLEYSAVWPSVDGVDRESFWKTYSAEMNGIYRRILRWGVLAKARIYLRNHRRAEGRKHAR